MLFQSEYIWSARYKGISYSIGPQHLWHQGIVSWKTIFPWMGWEVGGVGVRVQRWSSCQAVMWVKLCLLAGRSPPAVGPVSLQATCHWYQSSLGAGDSWVIVLRNISLKIKFFSGMVISPMMIMSFVSCNEKKWLKLKSVGDRKMYWAGYPNIWDFSSCSLRVNCTGRCLAIIRFKVPQSSPLLSTNFRVITEPFSCAGVMWRREGSVSVPSLWAECSFLEPFGIYGVFSFFPTGGY